MARTDDEDYKPNRPTKQEKLAKAVRDNTKKWNRVIVRTRRKIKKAQEKQSVKKRVHHKDNKLNDFVMKKNYQTSGEKLRNYFLGPYVVVRQTRPVTYKIRDAANTGSKLEIRHYDEL